MNSRSIATATVAAVLLVAPVSASLAQGGRADPPTSMQTALQNDDFRKDPPWRSFGDVTKGAQLVNGLFTLYLKRDNIYLSLRPEQFDRDYLLVTQLSQGIGELGLDGGATVRSDLVRFHRTGDRIEMWVVNSHVGATAGTPAARAVELSFGHSVAQSLPIATVRDTTEVLIDVAPFFVSDWADIGAIFQSIASQRRLGGNIAFDRERSSVLGVRAFPTNVEADARITYQTNRNLTLETVSDYRWIPVGVHYSLLDLPATPMRPRYADDRIGYFVSAWKDFSRDTAETFFVRYVNRWRLVKADPSAALSEPVHPITYYIDRTVPLQWRPYVREGILEWNRAFEAAGFKNAIQVLDAPEDPSWSAEDARYSTVRWTATNNSVYAIGPSNVDPRTGEILNADVLISASWVQAWRGEETQYVAPLTAMGDIFQTDSLLHQGTRAEAALLCGYGGGLARAATTMRTAFVASGLIPAGGALPEDYIGRAIKALVMHEIGHTLGLRHNFRGSAGITAAQLADRAYTAVHGIGVSVMDYTPPAVASNPSMQGDYYSPTIGSYDRWAIAYGYAAIDPLHGPDSKGAERDMGAWTPDAELPSLHGLARLSSQPGHEYASDEDAAFGGYGLDPTVTRYDQTDDPLGWAQDRVTLIDGLFDSLETRIVAPGENYVRLRSAFTDLLSDRWYATLVATKYIGGAITSRAHRGDPDGRPAFVDVPAAKQRQALAFLARAAFSDNAYRFAPDLLSKLAPDRWTHWGRNAAAADRIDFPLHDWATSQQQTLLNVIFDPAVLSRIRDAELRAGNDSTAMTLPELFRTLTDSIWAEVAEPAAKTGRAGRRARAAAIEALAAPDSARTVSTRRDVQRLYLATLTRLVVNPLPGTPEDARSIARLTLTELGDRLDRTLKTPKLDIYTRAHLADSRERIRQTLDAAFVQTAGPAR